MLNKIVSTQDHVRCDEDTIKYWIRRSTRRKKTISLIVNKDGVHIAAPRSTSNEELRDLVIKRSTWILRHQRTLSLLPGPLRFVSGEFLPYLGHDIRLIVEHSDLATSKVRPEDQQLRITVPTDLSDVKRRELSRHALLTWYFARATEILPKVVGQWCAKLAYGPAPRTLIRNQRSRWGSCATDRTIRLNWRLVMLARSHIDYIVVHELSHLRIRNHSPAFWNLVGQSIPDFSQRRRQLQEIGTCLPL